MKAEIIRDKLVLMPESFTEVYAAEVWVKNSFLSESIDIDSNHFLESLDDD